MERESILKTVRLSSGDLAWPVAKASGMSEVTFRARLKRMSADEAVSLPVARRLSSLLWRLGPVWDRLDPEWQRRRRERRAAAKAELLAARRAKGGT